MTDILFSEFKWSLSPALVAVYVAYHVDRQIDLLLPDITSVGSYPQLAQPVVMCILFGLIVTWLSLQPSLALNPITPSAWPVEKLRAVVIGTVFTTGVIMALVGEFCLIKPAARLDASASGEDESDVDTHRHPSPNALPSG